MNGEAGCSIDKETTMSRDECRESKTDTLTVVLRIDTEIGC